MIRNFINSMVQKGLLNLWFALLLLILMLLIGEWRIGVPGLFVFVFLLYYNFRHNYNKKKEVEKYIQELNFDIDSASKGIFLNFSMPLLVAELDGTIVWHNSVFAGMFQGRGLLEKTVRTLVNGMDIDDMIKNPSKIVKEMKVNDRNYNLFGNLIQREDVQCENRYILVLYFIDSTNYNEAKIEFENEKAVTGIIVIDNYDELIKGMEGVTRPQMLAEIEKKLTDWSRFAGGILEKFERDRYIYMFKNVHLKEFENKKFSVIDDVKCINTENNITVTLSIGLGMNGKTLFENFQYANAAIDIALGRGGDQVVIKNGNDVSFYGGKTRELEKRTKVKARVIAYALRELIKQCSNVIIMGHVNCDIDSLGASLGVYRIAKNQDKEANIVLQQSNYNITSIMEKVKNEKEYENLFLSRKEALDKVTRNTLLIVVDTHRPGFTECPELLKKVKQIVVIDHHRRGTDFIKNATLTYQETYASSTCEMISEILQYVEEKITLKPVETEALYAGIVVDTNNFSFKTGVRTFEAAAFLRRQGVDTMSVKQLFRSDIATYINVANIVKNVDIVNKTIAISICPPNIENAQLVSAKAADQLVGLVGITVAFVIGKSSTGAFISGRSLGVVNVQFIMEKLGGGGHFTGAGTQIEGASVNKAKEMLKDAIEEYFKGVKTN